MLQSSIGEKIANLIFAISTCIAGIVYALVYGWLFALACILYLPLLIGTIAFFGAKVRALTNKRLDSLKRFAGAAEESLSAVKVVASFCNEDKEIEKFRSQCEGFRSVANQQSLS